LLIGFDARISLIENIPARVCDATSSREMAANAAEFIQRLQAISEHDGVPYGRLRILVGQEDKHEQSTLQFRGHYALSDAFKCFFLETVTLFNTECRSKVATPLSEFYGLFVTHLTHNFRTLCGAERVALRGYPYQGYTLLRNAFDDLVLTSAALQKLTDFYSIEGIKPGKAVDPVEVRKLRKSTELAVRKKMAGSQSGLSQQTIVSFAGWDELFDYETHGSRLSLTHALGWLNSTAPLPVLPIFDETAFAIFMNRYCEIGWMAHRLIPAIQPPDAPLADQWKRKWLIIDASFETMVKSLTEECGKKIGVAIVEFVRTKFPFNEQSAFPL
jgi:hypothetical protein